MAINKIWSLKTSVTIHYDHEPAEGFKKTDTITETFLVYNF
jgi:putative salt-induced outer membrane protein YdiY